MSDDWILDLSADGGIELSKRGGGNTEFPPIIIIRGWHEAGGAPASELANRYFLQEAADGAAPSHYVLGGTDTDLATSAIGDAVTAWLTSYDPESGSFGATLGGHEDP